LPQRHPGQSPTVTATTQSYFGAGDTDPSGGPRSWPAPPSSAPPQTTIQPPARPPRRPRPRGPARAAARARPASLADLARELHSLKQDGRLSDQARAAAVTAWETRRAAPDRPADATQTPAPAQPPAAATAPAQGGVRGYRPDPEWEAVVAAMAAAAEAEETDWRDGAEDFTDQEG
jgi:hypothetical protein